jgi:hypothetical protein
MKAMDIGDDDDQEQEELFREILGEKSPLKAQRKQTWKLHHKKEDNLNDSRHNDFDGFEEYFEEDS